MAPSDQLVQFLQPLRMDLDIAYDLSLRFLDNFQNLSAHSTDQFLPTPISESILRPGGARGSGRYVFGTHQRDFHINLQRGQCADQNTDT
jgi:hypothetical protein